MVKPALLLATVAAVVGTPAAAQRTAADVDTLLRTAVEHKRVPMVVAMVADARGVVYEHATGASKDTIFAVASMTKPITSVAVMQLVEAGRVKLEEPAATYVPSSAASACWMVASCARRRPPSRCGTC